MDFGSEVIAKLGATDEQTKTFSVLYVGGNAPLKYAAVEGEKSLLGFHQGSAPLLDIEKAFASPFTHGFDGGGLIFRWDVLHG